MLWHKKHTLQEINKYSIVNMMENMNMIFTDITDNMLQAEMKITKILTNPIGFLHGGASAAFAESIASAAANLTIDQEHYIALGAHISADHLKPVKVGQSIKGHATALHIGKKTQVWKVNILHNDKLVCFAKMSAAIVLKK